MQHQERISLEDEYEDNWICVCGNTPPGDGFYTCDEQGNEVEPTEGSWDGVLYVCVSEGCGRLIDQYTLEVVGRNPNPKRIDWGELLKWRD